MRKLMLVLALVVLLAFSGSVMAAQSGTGTTTVTAKFADPTITVDPPKAYTWELQKTGDNQKNIGDVKVTSNDAWTLTIFGSDEGFLVYPSTVITASAATTRFALPVSTILSDNAWHTLGGSASPQVLKTGVATTGQDVPVLVSQVVSPNDQTPATITLTFTGTIP
jgi:hypothetical protein